MGVTVNDILQLPPLKDAVLISGERGLFREVVRVNFTDCPLEGEADYSLVMKGDLYIRSFYMDKDDEQKIDDIIRFYIETESCCCLALNQYLTEFPQKTLQMAEQAGYPIITIDRNVPYGELIRSISELIMTEQSDWIAENKINRLLYDSLSPEEISEVSGCLAPNLAESYRILQAALPDLSSPRFAMLRNDLRTQFHSRFYRYQRGGFLVMNLAEPTDFSSVLPALTRLLGYCCPQFHLGISSRCEGNVRFASGFKEAADALEIGSVLGSAVTCYDDLSVYRLLLPLRNHPVLREFCGEILGPLKAYERHQSIRLLETLTVYLENDGDYKKTAARLGQHENTIRFRVGKARSLLGLEHNHCAFVERVSIALRAQKLLGKNGGPKGQTSV